MSDYTERLSPYLLERLLIWSLIALLTGAWLWLQSDIAAAEDRISEANQRADKAAVTVAADHDEVVRIREALPRIERRLDRIEKQNEEILKELRDR